MIKLINKVLTQLKEDLVVLKPNINHMKFPKHLPPFKETAGSVYMEQDLNLILTQNQNSILNFGYNFQVVSFSYHTSSTSSIFF